MRKFSVRWWHNPEWLQERNEQLRCSLREDAEDCRTKRLVGSYAGPDIERLIAERLIAERFKL
jgi:hypothetical protein